MSIEIKRWLLAPRTSWQAWHMSRRKENRDFDAAWRRSRVLLCPDEIEFRDHGHQPPSNPTVITGVNESRRHSD
ncbi:hypothetical protein [Streptacidiphilus cavernicola]|uniref:Uncharacterized protein n=1 Tax=Streptacidiphilus cavernicola TaxID=3342716 RepID=A0ABV6VMX9_9ACTN